MDEATIHEVRQWLYKADHDLRSAARLMSGDEEPLLDTAVYHCQQAAEKVLKAYLTYCAWCHVFKNSSFIPNPQFMC